MEGNLSVPGQQQKTFWGRKSALIIGVAFLLFILAATSYYFYSQYQGVQQEIQVSNSGQQNLINEVGKLMVLPEGSPRIATVTDVSQLPNEPFFANAKNGDKVLFYDQAGEAILYRPSINKIVNVSPISIVSVSPTPEPQTSTPSAAIQSQTATPSAVQ